MLRLPNRPTQPSVHVTLLRWDQTVGIPRRNALSSVARALARRGMTRTVGPCLVLGTQEAGLRCLFHEEERPGRNPVIQRGCLIPCWNGDLDTAGAPGPSARPLRQRVLGSPSTVRATSGPRHRMAGNRKSAGRSGKPPASSTSAATAAMTAQKMGRPDSGPRPGSRCKASAGTRKHALPPECYGLALIPDLTSRNVSGSAPDNTCCRKW